MKRTVFFIILLFTLSLVFAQEWNSFEVEKEQTKDSSPQDSSDPLLVTNTPVPEMQEQTSQQESSGQQSSSEEVGGAYTENFYYALYAAGIGIFIFIIFIYFFLRRPKDKWDNNKVQEKTQDKVLAKR